MCRLLAARDGQGAQSLFSMCFVSAGPGLLTRLFYYPVVPGCF